MKRLLLVLALLAPSASFAGEGEEPSYSAAFSRCMDASGGVTVAMRDCAAAEHKLQDARLNREYAALTRLLQTPQRRQLVKAQRAWLAYRGAECDFRSGREGGGTLGLIISDSCWLEFTARRANELAEQRTAEEDLR